jgi:hypothetical protein
MAAATADVVRRQGATQTLHRATIPPSSTCRSEPWRLTQTSGKCQDDDSARDLLPYRSSNVQVLPLSFCSPSQLARFILCLHRPSRYNMSSARNAGGARKSSATRPLRLSVARAARGASVASSSGSVGASPVGAGASSACISRVGSGKDRDKLVAVCGTSRPSTRWALARQRAQPHARDPSMPWASHLSSHLVKCRSHDRPSTHSAARPSIVLGRAPIHALGRTRIHALDHTPVQSPVRALGARSAARPSTRPACARSCAGSHTCRPARLRFPRHSPSYRPLRTHPRVARGWAIRATRPASDIRSRTQPRPSRTTMRWLNERFRRIACDVARVLHARVAPAERVLVATCRQAPSCGAVFQRISAI